ncbi:hypothetical protein [Cryobacterium ruanii]|nr:hypothetical protein [Cryobacterium ruanii]
MNARLPTPVGSRALPFASRSPNLRQVDAPIPIRAPAQLSAILATGSFS